MTDYITRKLAERTAAPNKRQLSISNSSIDFVSNDYLALARSEALYQKIAASDYSNITNKNACAWLSSSLIF